MGELCDLNFIKITGLRTNTPNRHKQLEGALISVRNTSKLFYWV